MKLTFEQMQAIWMCLGHDMQPLHKSECDPGIYVHDHQCRVCSQYGHLYIDESTHAWFGYANTTLCGNKPNRERVEEFMVLQDSEDDTP